MQTVNQSMCPDRGMGVCLVFASADLVQSMWWICFVLLYSMLKSVSTQASSFIINIVNISKLDQLYVLWITMAKSFIFFIPHSPKMAFAAVSKALFVYVCAFIYNFSPESIQFYPFIKVFSICAKDLWSWKLGCDHSHAQSLLPVPGLSRTMRWEVCCQNKLCLCWSD